MAIGKPTIESSSSTEVKVDFKTGTKWIALTWKGFGNTVGDWNVGEWLTGPSSDSSKAGQTVKVKKNKLTCPPGCDTAAIGCNSGNRYNISRAHKPLVWGYVRQDKAKATADGKITWSWPDTSGGYGRRYSKNHFTGYGWVHKCLKNNNIVANPDFKNNNEIKGSATDYRQMYPTALPAGQYEVVALNDDEYSVSDSFTISATERFTQEHFNNPCGPSANCGTVTYDESGNEGVNTISCSADEYEPQSSLQDEDGYDAVKCRNWYSDESGIIGKLHPSHQDISLSATKQSCFRKPNKCSCKSTPGCVWKRAGNKMTNTRTSDFENRNVRCSEYGCVSSGDNVFVNTVGWRSTYDDDGTWI